MRIAISTIADSAKAGSWQVIKNTILELKLFDRKNEYIIFVEKTYKDDFGDLPSNFIIKRVAITARQPILNIVWHGFILPFLLVLSKVNVLYLPWHSAAFIIKTKPTVVNILDLREYRFSNSYDKLRMLYRKTLLPISSRLSDKIITISEHAKKDIIRYLNAEEAKIEVIYCAPNKRYQLLDKVICGEYLKNKFSIFGDFILFVGQIRDPNKNIMAIINAFNKIRQKVHKKYKLVLVGKIDSSCRPILKVVEDLGLERDIVFTGYVDDEDLPYFYNAATIFLFPSLAEGFGIPVVEAMACGCPVLTSLNSAMSEIAKDAAVLVNPNCVDDIADNAISVLSDSVKRQTMAKNGVEQIKEFCWKRSAEQTLNVLLDVSR